MRRKPARKKTGDISAAVRAQFALYETRENLDDKLKRIEGERQSDLQEVAE